MPPGKLASQAGHAFLQAFKECERERPNIAQEYVSDPPGTKVVLSAPSESELRLAYEKAQYFGLPASLIIDSGHILPPHFDGNPIITALGIGPVRREEIYMITDYFPLV